MPGKWICLGNGEWVPQDTAAKEQGQPISREIGATRSIIKHGEWKKDAKLRKFDKPSDDQIRRLREEDDEKIRQQNDITPLVRETKKGLEIGKIRIHEGVIDDRNKQILPHTSVTDSRGIQHIVPAERVKAEVGPPEIGNLPERVSERNLIEASIQAVKMNRDAFKQRTIT